MQGFKWEKEELAMLEESYRKRTEHSICFPVQLRRIHSIDACRIKGKRLGLASKFTPRRLGLALWEDTEIAYLAGIIDGEGCIYDGTNNKSNNSWRLTINTTDLSLFHWLESKLGKGCSYRERRRDKSNRRQLYTFQAVAINDVLEILEYVSPYLIIKKEKALECIKYLTEKLAA